MAIDLVNDLNVSTSGNQHILPLIDHLMGWLMFFPFLTKRYKLLFMFLSTSISPSMCPRFILSDNGTEFKNQVMNDVLKQLGFDCIFSTPYHLQSHGKLEVVHKYLKPPLKKLCENYQDNWSQHMNQVLISYHVTSHLTTAKTPFLLTYGRYLILPLHQLLEPMQQFLSDHESAWLNLVKHSLASCHS